MCHMQTDGIKIDKHFPRNLGQYFTDGFGSDGGVVKDIQKSPSQSLEKKIRYLSTHL